MASVAISWLSPFVALESDEKFLFKAVVLRGHSVCGISQIQSALDSAIEPHHPMGPYKGLLFGWLEVQLRTRKGTPLHQSLGETPRD